MTALPPGCVAACPGCAHRGWTPAASLAQKQGWLARRLAPWAHALAPVKAAEDAARWHYRDKVQLSVAWQQGWQFGLRHRDELVAIPRCPVHSRRVAALIDRLTPLLPDPQEFRLAYLVQSGAQAVLVLKQSVLPDCAWLSPTLCDALADIGLEGLWLHLHPAAGKKVFAKNGWHLLWGQPRSRDARGLWYGPAAFQQLIPGLYHDALDRAEAFLNPEKETAVLDLYCGAGSTLTRWLERGAHTLGVEVGGEAVACARLNAPKAELLRGTCLHRLPQLQAWSEALPADVERYLYTNPPRTGMETAVTDWIADAFSPRRIAYLSCSAGTLARDLERLNNAGYRVESLLPYDFFPHTYHVETLALLERRPPP